jgi:glycosyltransferase involved in cell wall biosynthesis
METTAIRERLTTDTSGSRGTVSVCLLGQRYWVGKLEENLNQFGRSRLRAFAPPLNARFFRDLRKSLSADLIVRIGFRPGARTLRGRAFDALWSTLRLLNPNATRVFYWLGTDVLHTTEDLSAGKLRQRYYAKAKQEYHLADATWLAEELQEIGIDALPKTVTLPQIAAGDTPDLPAEFSVLAYIPDGRYRFYGGDCIYEAARNLPDIRFDVVGGLGAWVSKPLANLVFHGWQSDMSSFYRKATVVVRLMKHDGTGLTAVEGLTLGRHVIYSHPLPNTLRVAWGDSDALIETLSGLLDLHKRGLLRLNTAGRAYAEENFNHHRRMEDLISYFLKIAGNRRPKLNGR